MIGTCLNDTENKCRHSGTDKLCEGCVQLYLIDGNHRFLAINHIREMKEKPEHVDQAKWDCFRAEKYHIPVDIYHSIPSAVSRLFAYCASEAQVKSALGNSNADSLKFAWEMYALTRAANVRLTNKEQIKDFLATTSFAHKGKHAGVIMWYFRMLKCIESLPEGEHTPFADPFPPFPLLGDGQPLGQDKIMRE